MANLNKLSASIKSSVEFIGSVSSKQIFNGSLKYYETLKGSVVTFAVNLSIRGILTPIVAIIANANVFRNIRGVITPILSATARARGYKNAKAIITVSVQMSAFARAFKRLSQILFIRPIIGGYSILKNLDLFTLEDLDIQKLFELEFSEGVIGTVLKNSKGVISPIVEISASIKTLQYAKIGDMDNYTLSSFDANTLGAIQEIVI